MLHWPAWTPAQAELTNLLTQPPFISGHKMDGEKTQLYQPMTPPTCSSLESSHPGEEGKLINISLGYEVIPLCMGPGKLCINVGRQTWAFVLPPKEDFWTLLPLLSVNHVYY